MKSSGAPRRVLSIAGLILTLTGTEPVAAQTGAPQPSLQETLDWLKGTLDQYGGGRSWNGSQEPYYAIGYHSLKLTRAAGCDLELTVGYYGSYMQGEETERRRGTQSVSNPFTLKLSEYSPEIQRFTSYTYIDPYAYGVKYFQNTEKHPHTSFDVLRLSRTGGPGGTVSGSVDLFIGRNVADRVYRAFRHAIALCGGKAASTLFSSDAPLPPPAVEAALPPPYEFLARDAQRSLNVSLGQTSYGPDVVMNAPPFGPALNIVEYDINSASDMVYRLQALAASAEPRPVRVVVNGQAVTDAAFGDRTSGWNQDSAAWMDGGEITLRRGANVLRLERHPAFPHLVRIRLVPVRRL